MATAPGNLEVSRLVVRWSSWRLKWSLGRFILGALRLFLACTITVLLYIHLSSGSAEQSHLSPQYEGTQSQSSAVIRQPAPNIGVALQILIDLILTRKYELHV